MPSKKDNGAPKAVRGPYRMDERLKLIKALKEMGAKNCEVDGVKVEFTSGESCIEPVWTGYEGARKAVIPPNLEYLAKAPQSGDNQPEHTPEPPIAGSQHPDEFSRQSDMWANYQPLRR